MVRYDGPFTISRAHPDSSTHTLDLPATMRVFPTFHSSLLRPYLDNDALFPGRTNPQPGPVVVTENGEEVFFVEKILNRHRVGRGWQYLFLCSPPQVCPVRCAAAQEQVISHRPLICAHFRAHQGPGQAAEQGTAQGACQEGPFRYS